MKMVDVKRYCCRIDIALKHGLLVATLKFKSFSRFHHIQVYKLQLVY